MGRIAGRLGIAAALGVIAVAVAPGTASAAPGTVTGVVTGPNGLPVEDANVQLSGRFHTFGTETDENGDYTLDLDSLPLGDRFTVSFRADGLAFEYYDDVRDSEEAERLDADGTSHQDIDAQLDAAGGIAGRVTGPGGGPLEEVCVDAIYLDGDNGDENTQTDPAGEFTFEGLAPGRYRLFFQPCDASTLAPEYYDDATRINGAQPVSVAPGEHVTGIDAQLTTGATISGTVTDGVAPVAGFCVEADGDVLGGFGEATTQANGTYTIAGLHPGAYTVWFEECNGTATYAKEFFDDEISRERAEKVVVGRGEARAGVDAELGAAATITGTVTDGTDPLPACAQLTTATDPEEVDYAFPDNLTGEYELLGLPAGEYKLHFEHCGSGSFAYEWFDDQFLFADATVINLGEGETFNADAVLGNGGAISGTVTGPGDVPLEEICVSVEDPDAESMVVEAAETDASGEYVLSNVPPGDVVVRFDDCSGSGWATELYDGATTVESADLVTVAEGATTANIDAQLELGGDITGVVTDSAGVPLSDICVEIYDSEGNLVDDEDTSSHGRYVSEVLAAGQYRIGFIPCLGEEEFYVAEFNDDKPDLASADPVTVVGGERTDQIDAELADVAGPPPPPPPPPPPEADVTPPVVTFTKAPKRRTRDRTPTFAWRADEEATFVCAIDKRRLRTCYSPKTTSPLKRGRRHRLRVIATDTAGNVTKAKKKFRVTKKKRKRRR